MKKVVITAVIYENDKLMADGAANGTEAVKQAVAAAYKAGAAIIHLHLNHDGKKNAEHGMKHLKSVMKEIYEIYPEILVILELYGTDIDESKDEFRIVADEPEVAVLNCDIGKTFVHDVGKAEAEIRKLGNTMLDNGVRPLLKCCDKGMVDTAMRFYREGWITDPLLFVFVLGVRGGMDATIDNLMYLKNAVPQNASWSVECAGEYDYTDMVAAAVLMGGNISVGDDSCSIADTAERVRHAVEIIKLLGRRIASPAEARAVMSLNLKYRRVIDEHLL